MARAERRPVVLSVPLDLQQQAFPYLPDYTPSTDLVPRRQVVMPDPALVDEVVAMIAGAERPVVIGGRGAVWSGAREALEALAEQSGALVGDDPVGQGAVRRQPVRARHRRHVFERSRPRILRRERSRDRRRRRARPLHDRGRLSLPERQGGADRREPARAVAGAQDRRPAYQGRRPRHRRGDRPAAGRARHPPAGLAQQRGRRADRRRCAGCEGVPGDAGHVGPAPGGARARRRRSPRIGTSSSPAATASASA